MRARTVVLVLALAATAAPAGAGEPPVAQDRSVEPVILRGSQFPVWSAGPDPTLREQGPPTNYGTGDIHEPLPPGLRSDCYEGRATAPGTGPNPYDDSDNGDHNCYQSSRLPRGLAEGAPVDRILGYRWSAGTGSFEQIPFQVDERFTRYLSNNYSDFAFYSGIDAHNSYAFDREGFRYSWDAALPLKGGHAAGSECMARPAPGSTIVGGYATTADPVRGLDDDDELVFMWRDAGPRAPSDAQPPDGIGGSYEVVVADPSDPENTVYAYVMLAAEGGPAMAFTADNSPYVRYERDPGVPDPDDPAKWAEPPADMFLYSQSGYRGYGAAPKGPYCALDGTVSTTYRRAADRPQSPADPLGRAIEQRRPADTAWVKTPRYWFRYDGRWVMNQLRVSPDDSALAAGVPDEVGPDIIDQWKARAFQQRPGGQTPCCGYEEEVNNWGGSSILLGERWGAVRAIRATWGADSSTNNIRTEIFYRDEIRFADHLRVHPIPPLDGIYVQWDYNAGTVETYYNPWRPDGVPVDGQNDEVFGNLFVHVAPDKIEVRDDDDVPVTGPISAGVPLPGSYDDCRLRPVDNQRLMCNDIDVHDPTFSGPVGTLNWEQLAGRFGSVVTRWWVMEDTPGGTPQSVIAMPYYRDDSCFDDGTGSNPGPHLRLRGVDSGESATYYDPVAQEWKPRECWLPEHGDPALDPAGPRRFWQGSIGTHGLHLHIIAESDNAGATAPLTEIVSEQRMVVLRGDPGNVGERYGRHVEYPLTATAAPLT